MAQQALKPHRRSRGRGSRPARSLLAARSLPVGALGGFFRVVDILPAVARAPLPGDVPRIILQTVTLRIVPAALVPRIVPQTVTLRVAPAALVPRIVLQTVTLRIVDALRVVLPRVVALHLGDEIAPIRFRADPRGPAR